MMAMRSEAPYVLEQIDPVTVNTTYPMNALTHNGHSLGNQFRVGASKVGIRSIRIPFPILSHPLKLQAYLFKIAQHQIGKLCCHGAKPPRLGERQGVWDARDACHSVWGTTKG